MDRLRFGLIGCGRIAHSHAVALGNNSGAAVLAAVCDIDAGRAGELAESYCGIPQAGGGAGEAGGAGHASASGAAGAHGPAQALDQTVRRQGPAGALAQAGACRPAVFADRREMLRQTELDAVAICTESGSHAEIAVDCLERGLHVLVEKPLALSMADADRMIGLAARKGLRLGVCHQNRFNPAIQKLRRAVDDGRFGRIVNGTARILWNRNMEYYSQAPWRGTWKHDGGTLMNQCIHNI
ncbi:MAG: Gfo/Idh/MocA family oxidoreductase, partial [Clostridiales Family XIII bacterium]|nr:Gfo/Idh/MocA family oxidoreductase [Clostridiales Family XIII bacterium]